MDTAKHNLSHHIFLLKLFFIIKTRMGKLASMEELPPCPFTFIHSCLLFLPNSLRPKVTSSICEIAISISCGKLKQTLSHTHRCCDQTNKFPSSASLVQLVVGMVSLHYCSRIQNKNLWKAVENSFKIRIMLFYTIKSLKCSFQHIMKKSVFMTVILTLFHAKMLFFL